VTAGARPTLRRRRLGAELRRLREQAELTIQDVASHLECSGSKVSRIETGHVSATPRDVRDMLQLYGVGDERREALIRLARELRRPGWWTEYADVPGGIRAYASLETAASSIDTFMTSLVPSLLQTPDYARAVMRAILPDLARGEVDRRVELRIKRQAVLDEADPPTLRAVLDEALLGRRIGPPEVMAEQIRHLADTARRPAVTLQVLPLTAGGHAGLDGPFTVLGYADRAEPDFVVLDSVMGELYLETDEELRRYRDVFDRLRAAAYGPERSVALLRERQAELEAGSAAGDEISVGRTARRGSRR
jgi:transcriptional regulator with XRE-family HTH domain